MEKMQIVYDYLNKKGWVVLDDLEEQVELLTSGISNENYLITATEIYGEAQYVFRVNHASPFGLEDHADYEYTVLLALRRSGVTPRPFYSDCATAGDLGQGALLMEYIPGRQLDAANEYELAARVLAAVHSQPVDDRLIVRKSPSDDDNDLVMSHGAPCASDFIVGEEGDRAWLVDWENCTVASRYADLGFFLAHASLDANASQLFIESYVEATGIEADIADVFSRAMRAKKAAANGKESKA